MQHRLWTTTFTYLCLASALGLTGCGGGGDGEDTVSKDPGRTSTLGTEVSLNDFDVLTKSGVWRTDVDLDTDFIFDFEYGSNVFHIDGYMLAFSTVVSEINVGASATTVSYCDASGSELVTDTTVNGEDFIGEEDANFFNCNSAITSSYFVVSDSQYRIEMHCGSDRIGAVEMRQLSATPTFNQGTLSFGSDQYNDLDASAGVCGGTADSYVELTLSDQGLGLEDDTATYAAVNVAAPYGDSQINFAFSFLRTVTPGTYSIVSALEIENEANQTAVNISSPEFGGSDAAPDALKGISGSLSIISIADRQASGTFDIATGNGTNFNGSFSFNLE